MTGVMLFGLAVRGAVEGGVGEIGRGGAGVVEDVEGELAAD